MSSAFRSDVPLVSVCGLLPAEVFLVEVQLRNPGRATPALEGQRKILVLPRHAAKQPPQVVDQPGEDHKDDQAKDDQHGDLQFARSCDMGGCKKHLMGAAVSSSGCGA